MKKSLAFWHLPLGLILGFGLGLVISWIIAPQDTVDAPPALLRADFKDEYRVLIASAYEATDDLPRAKTRLFTLGDEDSIVALESQAQRALASGDSYESQGVLAALAANLSQEVAATAITATSTRFITQTPRHPTQTGTPPTPTVTSTAEAAMPTLTPIPFSTRTPAATTEASPTASVPYILQTQDEICSTNISEALLMVYVSDKSQNAAVGVEIIVEWEGNEEHFFTGLKPELGGGYADFIMDAHKIYSLRLATGSVAVSGLSAPPCQDKDGNHYWGSLRLRFQQP